MTKSAHILCVDDDPAIGPLLEHALLEAGYTVSLANTVPVAMGILAKEGVDLVISDYRMPHMTGIEFIGVLKESYPDLPVIMLTGYGSIDLAVAAIKAGATDYIVKPPKAPQVVLAVKQALRVVSLKRQNKELLGRVAIMDAERTVLGQSASMRRVTDVARTVAPTKATVLLAGESGTGKELLAQYIHDLSERSVKPFIQLNCAALPEGLVESALFGHEKGAFTGAIKRVEGAFERAHGGTLLLDEISEMRLDLQAKLLRVLQEQEFERVGGTQKISVDVRVIATTNRELNEEVSAGRFRADLFYRLHVMPITIPPLRERREDIPLLAHTFAARAAKGLGKKFEGFTPEALEVITNLTWPGNVRELQHAIERAVILSVDPLVGPQFFDGQRSRRLAEIEKGGDTITLPEGTGVLSDGRVVLADLNVEVAERYLMSEALRLTEGHKPRAAVLLGMSPRTLRNKLAAEAARVLSKANGERDTSSS